VGVVGTVVAAALCLLLLLLLLLGRRHRHRSGPNADPDGGPRSLVYVRP